MTSPTELAYFTATGFYYDVESPLPGGTTNADQFNGLTGGFISFYPRVPAGFTLLIPDLDLGSGNTGSTAVALAPITGRIIATVVNNATVWQLATINTTDTPGIQLLANTTPVSTALAAEGVNNGQLIYDVQFSQVTFAGADQYISDFAFAAPTSAGTVCITDPGLTQLPYAGPKTTPTGTPGQTTPPAHARA